MSWGRTSEKYSLLRCTQTAATAHTSVTWPEKDLESISSDFDILELKDSGTQVVLSSF